MSSFLPAGCCATQVSAFQECSSAQRGECASLMESIWHQSIFSTVHDSLIKCSSHPQLRVHIYFVAPSWICAVPQLPCCRPSSGENCSITESLRLDKSCRIMESNCHPIPSVPIKAKGTECCRELSCKTGQLLRFVNQFLLKIN